MNIDLSNKRALVCGGSHGIGRAIAIQFAKCGCSVIILARNEDPLVNLINELNSIKINKHKYIVADLSDYKEIERIANNELESCSIDILINNSSGPLPEIISEIKIEEITSSFHQHFISSFILIAAVVKYMKIKRSGRIINILGTSVKEPILDLGLSSVKAMIANYTKILSKELGEFGITVNNVLPGPTKTNELNKITRIIASKEEITINEFENIIIKETALKRLGNPEEIAYAVAFLASEYASFITGSNLIIDGGYMSGI